ncbi:hypothetical protein EIG78_12205 [Avibacterium paragallinarum]|nr:hypothetical protein EIG78_12205 [Avibacterium paragallinarum]
MFLPAKIIFSVIFNAEGDFHFTILTNQRERHYKVNLDLDELLMICPQKVRLYSNFIQGLSSVFHRA